MANDCCGTMRVVAKNKEAIDRFERVMQYNGFGDEFMEFMCSNEIYDHEN